MRVSTIISALAASPWAVGADFQGLRKIDIQEPDEAGHSRKLWWRTCENHGEGCGPFNWCCDGLSCHPSEFKCYHSPRREGEPCYSVLYSCEDGLTCQNNKCIDLANILESGKKGQCSSSTLSNAGSVSIVTYNLFLIITQLFNDLEGRAKDITRWFGDTQREDIVVFQEVFTNYDTVRDGMASAGYCHYVTTRRGQLGSGLAIYSKFPITEFDFIDFRDLGDSLNPETLADKGVMYAKIEKGGRAVHVFNTHTTSEEFIGDQHSDRVEEYDIMRKFISEKNIPPTELVLMAGDFNEDKFQTTLYENMLRHLDAGEIPVVSDLKLTFDGPGNSLAPDEERQILDYVFYDKASLAPSLTRSTCEVLKPVNGEGDDLSDHQPVSCTIHYSNWS